MAAVNTWMDFVNLPFVGIPRVECFAKYMNELSNYVFCAHTKIHTAAMQIALLSTILVFTKRALHKLSAEQVQLKMRHTANAATKLAVTVVETWSADPAEQVTLEDEPSADTKQTPVF